MFQGAIASVGPFGGVGVLEGHVIQSQFAGFRSSMR